MFAPSAVDRSVQTADSDRKNKVNKHRQMGPEQIQARSFEIIGQLLPDFDQSSPHWPIIRRVVHTVGDPSIAPLVLIHPGAVPSGVGALLAARPILTDVRMVAAGISRKLAGRLGCEVLCALDEPPASASAPEQPNAARRGEVRQMTSSAAGIRAISRRIPGSIVAIGNAPTALFELLEMLRDGLEPPALVVGTPVGFVGAAESKRELVSLRPNVPYITLEGTRGGSAVAVAAINALLVMSTAEAEGVGTGSGNGS